MVFSAPASAGLPPEKLIRGDALSVWHRGRRNKRIRKRHNLEGPLHTPCLFSRVCF